MIDLPFGDRFDEEELVKIILASGRDYIIQGQQNVALNDHSKPNSLDYWLRQFNDKPNTKQAIDEVMESLFATGKFKTESKLLCPDSGQRCKGLRLNR